MSETWVIAVPSGEEVISYVENRLASKGIIDGAIVGCLGVFKEARIHWPVTLTWPAEEGVETIPGPIIVNSGSGIIESGKIHFHVNMRDKERILGGHLEMAVVFEFFRVIVSSSISQ